MSYVNNTSYVNYDLCKLDKLCNLYELFKLDVLKTDLTCFKYKIFILNFFVDI